MNQRGDYFGWELGFFSWLGSYPLSLFPSSCSFFALPAVPLRLLFRFLFLPLLLLYPFCTPSIPFSPVSFLSALPQCFERWCLHSRHSCGQRADWLCCKEALIRALVVCLPLMLPFAFLYSRDRDDLLAVSDLSHDTWSAALSKGRRKGGRRGSDGGLFLGESGREGDVLSRPLLL